MAYRPAHNLWETPDGYALELTFWNEDGSYRADHDIDGLNLMQVWRLFDIFGLWGELPEVSYPLRLFHGMPEEETFRDGWKFASYTRPGVSALFAQALEPTN